MKVEAQNFRKQEFECKCGCGRNEIKDYHIINLQAFRYYLFRKHGVVRLFVTSGYRCPEHNKAVGGVPNSRHILGDASDIYSPDLETEKLYEEAKMFGGFSTVIFYTKSGFLHLDSRPNRVHEAWKWVK